MKEILMDFVYTGILVLAAVLLLGVPLVSYITLRPNFTLGEIFIIILVLSSWGGSLRALIYIIHKSSKGLLYGKAEDKET